MGNFRFQLLLEVNTWSKRYKISEKGRYSDSPTEWTKLSLSFTVEKYGNNFIPDEIECPHADMCFSDVPRTHFV